MYTSTYTRSPHLHTSTYTLSTLPLLTVDITELVPMKPDGARLAQPCTADYYNNNNNDNNNVLLPSARRQVMGIICYNNFSEYMLPSLIYFCHNYYSNSIFFINFSLNRLSTGGSFKDIITTDSQHRTILK